VQLKSKIKMAAEHGALQPVAMAARDFQLFQVKNEHRGAPQFSAGRHTDLVGDSSHPTPNTMKANQ